MIKSILALLILCLSHVSCDRPKCKNQNPIFDSYSIDSKEYKNELAKEITRIETPNLRYWLNSYLEENGKEYIVVYIQNDELCAKGILEVKEWTKIEGIKKRKGVSYRGAELLGLEFEIYQTDSTTNFIYKNLERIID